MGWILEKKTISSSNYNEEKNDMESELEIKLEFDHFKDDESVLITDNPHYFSLIRFLMIFKSPKINFHFTFDELRYAFESNELIDLSKDIHQKLLSLIGKRYPPHVSLEKNLERFLDEKDIELRYLFWDKIFNSDGNVIIDNKTKYSNISGLIENPDVYLKKNLITNENDAFDNHENSVESNDREINATKNNYYNPYRCKSYSQVSVYERLRVIRILLDCCMQDSQYIRTILFDLLDENMKFTSDVSSFIGSDNVDNDYWYFEIEDGCIFCLYRENTKTGLVNLLCDQIDTLNTTFQGFLLDENLRDIGLKLEAKYTSIISTQKAKVRKLRQLKSIRNQLDTSWGSFSTDETSSSHMTRRRRAATNVDYSFSNYERDISNALNEFSGDSRIKRIKNRDFNSKVPSQDRSSRLKYRNDIKRRLEQSSLEDEKSIIDDDETLKDLNSDYYDVNKMDVFSEAEKTNSKGSVKSPILHFSHPIQSNQFIQITQPIQTIHGIQNIDSIQITSPIQNIEIINDQLNNKDADVNVSNNKSANNLFENSKSISSPQQVLDNSLKKVRINKDNNNNSNIYKCSTLDSDKVNTSINSNNLFKLNNGVNPFNLFQLLNTSQLVNPTQTFHNLPLGFSNNPLNQLQLSYPIPFISDINSLDSLYGLQVSQIVQPTQTIQSTHSVCPNQIIQPNQFLNSLNLLNKTLATQPLSKKQEFKELDPKVSQISEPSMLPKLSRHPLQIVQPSQIVQTSQLAESSQLVKPSQIVKSSEATSLNSKTHSSHNLESNRSICSVNSKQIVQPVQTIQVKHRLVPDNLLNSLESIADSQNSKKTQSNYLANILPLNTSINRLVASQIVGPVQTVSSSQNISEHNSICTDQIEESSILDSGLNINSHNVGNLNTTVNGCRVNPQFLELSPRDEVDHLSTRNIELENLSLVSRVSHQTSSTLSSLRSPNSIGTP